MNASTQQKFWDIDLPKGNKMADRQELTTGSTTVDPQPNSESKKNVNGKAPKKKTVKKVTSKSKAKKKKSPPKKISKMSQSSGRRRGQKPYPVVAFEDVLVLPNAIQLHGAGNPVRRLRLMDLMNLSPTSRTTRDLITNSGKYGLTSGNHGAAELSLTDEGRVVVDPSSSPRQRRQAEFDLAIKGVEPFRLLYDKYSGGAMPSLEVMQDELEDINLGDRKPCIDIFVGNAKYVGLLKPLGGVQHLLNIEDALDELARTVSTNENMRQDRDLNYELNTSGMESVSFEDVCFFIAPIGDKKSDDPVRKKQRQHSDTILNQYVKRALEEEKLRVVRADEIEEAGMISKQIIEYILRSRLVIADLSYSNPNVFYELCLRHVTGLPTVHIIKDGDRIPFDVGNFRTITIALDDVHDALAQIDTHRAEIADYVRSALKSDHSRENPILTFYPKATFSIGDE